MHSPDPESGAGGRLHQPSESGYELDTTVSTNPVDSSKVRASRALLTHLEMRAWSAPTGPCRGWPVGPGHGTDDEPTAGCHQDDRDTVQACRQGCQDHDPRRVVRNHGVAPQPRP